MVYELPYEIYDYALTSFNKSTTLYLKNFKDFHYEELQLLTQEIGNDQIEIMIKNNYDNLLKYVLQNYNQVKKSENINQRLRTEWDGTPLITMKMCEEAAFYGNLNLLIYLYNNFSEHKNPILIDYIYLSSEERRMFANSQSTYTITPIEQKKKQKPKLSNIVANNSANHPEMFKYLVENKLIDATDDYGGVCNVLARARNLELLKYANNHGYSINSLCSIIAVQYNNLELLKFLMEKKEKIDINCLLHIDTSESLDNLKFFNDNIFKLPNTPIYDNLYFGYEDKNSYGLKLCNKAAINGDLECFKYALSKGCNYTNDKSLTNPYDYYDILYILDGEYECNSCYKAAYHGQINILKYLHENNYEICSNSLISAVIGHKLDCLKYLFDIGCTTELNLLAHVAMTSDSKQTFNTKVIEYLIEKGFELNSKVYAQASNQRLHNRYIIDLCKKANIEKPKYCNYCENYYTYSCEDNYHDSY